jgi:hypothetical protein
MALELLNNYVALKNPTEARGLMRGEVIMVASGVTAVAVGDKAFYAKPDALTMDVSGQEVILLKVGQLVAKR